MLRVPRLFCSVILFFYLSIGARCDNQPKIVIIGAGASGIAAASKLLQNGYQNLLILEAEDRIGGRVHTTKFDEYVVDLGAQWVHGEKGNVVYEMVKPLDLVEHSTMERQYYDMYTAPGKILDASLAQNITQFFQQQLNDACANPEECPGSLEDFYKIQFGRYFEQHPEINETLRDQFMWHYNIMQTSHDPADHWSDISGREYTQYQDTEGDGMINWKQRGYSTVLDVMMKKIPHPEEELPVLNKTLLNKEVVKIDYSNEKGPVKVKTSDGEVYEADHVIITTSLGVLKAQHQTLFEPPLPEAKVNSIEALGFGSACKIFLAFDERWWDDLPQNRSGLSFLFDAEMRKEYEQTPGTEWIPSMAGFFFVQHKPRLLLIWVSGRGAKLADQLSDEQLFNQTVSTLNRFLSDKYNLTTPVSMIRSRWYENKHFRGTYSYRAMESTKRNAWPEELSQPIVRADKPVVLFGGEATNSHHFSTVHGAIETGWREADRLISYYGKSKDAAEDKQGT